MTAADRESSVHPRVALVTGASSGIGLATGIELARRGWRVWAGIRRPESERDVAAAVRLAGLPADRVRTIPLDVTDEALVQRAVESVLRAEHGRLDASIANAGFGAFGFVEELPMDVWRRVIDTDLLGAITTVRATLGPMRRQGWGHVVLVSSNAVNLPHPAFSPYAVAKWGLEGLGEALAQEVGPFGIAVTLVQPGATHSGFADRVIGGPDPESPYQPLLDRINVGFARLANGSRPAEGVAVAIADVLERARPPLRIRVGRDAHLAAALRHVVPGNIRRSVARCFFSLPRWPALRK